MKKIVDTILFIGLLSLGICAPLIGIYISRYINATDGEGMAIMFFVVFLIIGCIVLMSGILNDHGKI